MMSDISATAAISEPPATCRMLPAQAGMLAFLSVGGRVLQHADHHVHRLPARNER